MPAKIDSAVVRGGGELLRCVGLAGRVETGGLVDALLARDELVGLDPVELGVPLPEEVQAASAAAAVTRARLVRTGWQARTCPSSPTGIKFSNMPTLSYGAATDVGQVREHNEDALLAEPGIFVVADGMGGHAAGEVAAAMAVAELGRLANRKDVTAAEIAGHIASINAQVLAEVDRNPETEGMGTTITGVALTTLDGELHWIVFNVGDSRVYRRADGQLFRCTIDHSEVEELVVGGFITAQEARVHPRRNVVTRSIGSDPAPQPDIWILPAEIGERMLVCSDGLTTELDDGEIDMLLGSPGTPQEIADGLVERALIAGAHDNVTVVVAQLSE
jgi:serine/threonine protein phosphatase PrpC